MDFKKFTTDAGAFFNRAKQFTEEVFGQAEKTEYDAHLEQLISKANKTKLWTERIVSEVETMLDPNPTSRLQSKVFDAMSTAKATKLNVYDVLGTALIDAGNDLGNNLPYGDSLVKTGSVQQKIAGAQREYSQAVAKVLINPLKNFLDGDMKTIEKELKTLETKRLDLDSAKSRHKKAEDKSEVETELRNTQLMFDRQVEVVKQLLQGVGSIHAHHLKCLQEFVIAQRDFHELCQQYTTQLQDELAALSK